MNANLSRINGVRLVERFFTIALHRESKIEAEIPSDFKARVLRYLSKRNSRLIKPILSYMKHLHAFENSVNIEFPNTQIHNTVLASLCRNRQIKKASEVLHDMIRMSPTQQNCSPDMESFVLLARAYPRSLPGPIGSVTEQLLRDASTVPGYEPSQILYNLVLEAYARDSKHDSSAPIECQRIIWEMEQKCDKGYNIGPSPTSSGHLALAYARSESLESMRAIPQLLQRQTTQYAYCAEDRIRAVYDTRRYADSRRVRESLKGNEHNFGGTY